MIVSFEDVADKQKLVADQRLLRIKVARNDLDLVSKVARIAFTGRASPFNVSINRPDADMSLHYQAKGLCTLFRLKYECRAPPVTVRSLRSSVT